MEIGEPGKLFEMRGREFLEYFLDFEFDKKALGDGAQKLMEGFCGLSGADRLLFMAKLDSYSGLAVHVAMECRQSLGEEGAAWALAFMAWLASLGSEEMDSCFGPGKRRLIRELLRAELKVCAFAQRAGALEGWVWDGGFVGLDWDEFLSRWESKSLAGMLEGAGARRLAGAAESL